jgi:hypothetical protein
MQYKQCDLELKANIINMHPVWCKVFDEDQENNILKENYFWMKVFVNNKLFNFVN